MSEPNGSNELKPKECLDPHSLVSSMMKPFQIFHGTLSFLLVVIVLGGLIVGGYYLYDIRLSTKKTQEEFQLLNKNVISQNQQALILKVVDSNLKGSSIDSKVKVANMIYQICLIKHVPPSLVCAVIEHESSWDPSVRNSDSGATGLMQLIPRYAYPYLRSEKLPDSPETLLEPDVNVMIGISELYDHQRDHVALKRTKEDDWSMALHTYAWGKAATLQLYGVKDQKVDVPNLAYPLQVLKLVPKYKDQGLE